MNGCKSRETMITMIVCEEIWQNVIHNYMSQNHGNKPNACVTYKINVYNAHVNFMENG